ncbi:MAG: carbohydrate ABC transporter permease [Chloroflexia bacterium]|nr:carbohydrate ABC transporter permease [Chloroflexia bacterium]
MRNSRSDAEPGVAWQPRSRQERIGRVGIVLILAVFAVVAIYPIVFMGLSTFRTSFEYIANPVGWPESFSYVDNFIAVYYRFDLPQLFRNTLTYILLASLITLGVAVPASFTFAKTRFPGREGLRTAMIATLIMPPVTFLVPSYVMMARLGLIDTTAPLVLLWAATATPGTIFLLSALMRSIPDEILEAARIDGAGYFEVLLRIALPLSVPGLVTVMIFNITTWWNDLLLPLVLIGDQDKTTLTVAAAAVGSRFSMDFPLVLTGLFLVSIPPILAYLVLQRFIRRGLVAGAIK